MAMSGLRTDLPKGSRHTLCAVSRCFGNRRVPLALPVRSEDSKTTGEASGTQFQQAAFSSVSRRIPTSGSGGTRAFNRVWWSHWLNRQFAGGSKLVGMFKNLPEPAQQFFGAVSHVERVSPQVIDTAVLCCVIESVDGLEDSRLQRDIPTHTHER
jgi:hypothetical protein